MRNSVQKYEVIDFQVRRSKIVSLQLVPSYCPFPVSSSSSVAFLDAVEDSSIVNFDQSLIPSLFLHAFIDS